MTEFPGIISDDYDDGLDYCATADVRNVSEEGAFGYSYSASERGFNIIFLPIVMIIGVLDNCAFIFVVYRVKSMQTITNVYLVNLACADMMFITFAVVHKIVKIFTSPISIDDSGLGLEGCMVIFLFVSAAYNASMCFITAVSVERYNAVCNPLKMHQSQGSKRWSFTRNVCIVSWVVAFLVSSTFLPSYANYEHKCYEWPDVEPYHTWPTRTSHCNPFSLVADSYTSGAQTIPFFITLVVNFILHNKTLRGLSNSLGKTKGDGSRSERDAKIHSQTVRMLVVNSVLFFVFLSPFEFISLFVMINILITGGIVIPGKTLTVYIYIARTMTYLNSLSNPIIYTVFCKRYFNAFKEAFGVKPKLSREPSARIQDALCYVYTMFPAATAVTFLVLSWTFTGVFGERAMYRAGANRRFIDKTPINVQDKTRNGTAVAAGNIV